VTRDAIGIYALTPGAFAIGTTEFVPMGLLPQMVESLGVSIPAAGLLVTRYALRVAIGAPVLTLALSAVPRKAVLLILRHCSSPAMPSLPLPRATKSCLRHGS
jgi:DHA1 family inner membrane transport protein